MHFRLVVFSIFLSFFSLPSLAQKVPPKLSFGVEFKTPLNLGVLNADSVVLNETNGEFKSVYRLSGGLGFGGIVRIKLTEFWNIETGLHYTRQRYSQEFTDLLTGVTDENELNVIAYEIPIKGLVYVRLGERVFGNVTLGLSADFVASNVESFGLGNTYSFGAIRRSVARGALIGGLGVEYRTDEDGYFYLGGGFHQPFGDYMFTQVTYLRDGLPPPVAANGALTGAYFAIELRYFFPNKKDSRPKVRYVEPDWKNM